jgi:hypothetical protein
MGMQIAKVYRGQFSFIEVKNIHKDSIASLHGIRMGDLLYVEQATTTTVRLMEGTENIHSVYVCCLLYQQARSVTY